MRMLTKRLFLPLFVLVTFFGCRHRVEDINPTTWRVRTMKTDYEFITYTYTNGQLSQTNTQYTSLYRPHPNETCKNWAIKDGELLETMCETNQRTGFFSKIGANGKISEANRAYHYGKDFYDTKGFLIESQRYSTNDLTKLWGSHKYEILNNNVVKEWEVSNLKDYALMTYTYYEDKKNTIGNENFGMTWEGRSSENLVKTAGYYDNSQVPAIISYTANYEYDFDTSNRVIRKKERRPNGTLYVVAEYTYW
jgi:hypothetical protein